MSLRRTTDSNLFANLLTCMANCIVGIIRQVRICFLAYLQESQGRIVNESAKLILIYLHPGMINTVSVSDVKLEI